MCPSRVLPPELCCRGVRPGQARHQIAGHCGRPSHREPRRPAHSPSRGRRQGVRRHAVRLHCCELDWQSACRNRQAAHSARPAAQALRASWCEPGQAVLRLRPDRAMRQETGPKSTRSPRQIQRAARAFGSAMPCALPASLLAHCAKRIACCSADSIATKRAVGWRAAMGIASASAASFLPQGLNGLTNSAAMRQAVGPRAQATGPSNGLSHGPPLRRCPGSGRFATQSGVGRNANRIWQLNTLPFEPREQILKRRMFIEYRDRSSLLPHGAVAMHSYCPNSNGTPWPCVSWYGDRGTKR